MTGGLTMTKFQYCKKKMLKCNSEITGMMTSEANKSYMLPDIYEPTVVHRDERKIKIKLFYKIFKSS